jgi:O-antigen ligase
MVVCCGVALFTFKHEHWHGKKFWLGSFALLFLFVAFYLVPLPASFDDISLGVSNLSAIRNSAYVPDASPMLAAMPAAAWQSLLFLFAPLAVFLFAVQLSREDLLLTLPSVIFIGTASGIIGLLQIIGSADGPLYLYRITNHGSAVGLFANRNHAAVLLACLFPVLAMFAARSHATARGGRNTSQLIAIAIAVTLVPLILVTGSRAGMLTAVVGLLGGELLYTSQIAKRSGTKKGKSLVSLSAVAVLVGLVFATIYFSRAEAINRFYYDPSTANVRAGFWVSSLDLFWKYFPFGFGPSAFAQAFQNDEPLALLNGTYLNRLHNDWLETVLTFGVPGVLLLLIGVAYYVRRSFLLWARMDGARSAVALGRVASVIFAILAIASLSDYPLRTPAMMGLAALVMVWFAHARHQPTVAENRG